MNKHLRIILFFMLVISCASINVNAQLTISGKITDVITNKPLLGVTIILKQQQADALIGTVSDLNGNFKLDIPGSKGTLLISYISYKNQEIDVAAAKSSLEVKLETDVAKLDEIVVTGLATTVKRSNLANSVGTISAQELTGTTQAQTFDEALSGKVVGANIVANSGAPGGGVSVNIRGMTTLFGNSQPLYIVDGVYMNNSVVIPGLNFVTNSQAGVNVPNQDNPSNRIADLNANDIESVEILKGASAAAIYGSQAAAGVVIITTKKGLANGATAINFSQDIGMATASHLLGVRQFNAQNVQSTYNDSAVTALFLQAQAAGKIYDYEKEMYGEKGLLTNTRLSISGGSGGTSFYLSGSLKSEDGIVEGTGYDYRSMRGNVEQKISDKTTLTLNTSYVNSSADRGFTNNDNEGVTWGIALSSTPSFIDLHPDANGIYPSASPFAASNVLQTRDLVQNNETVNRTTNSIQLKSFIQQNEKTYTRLILNAGFDFYNMKTFAYFPPSLQFESNGNGTNGANLQGSTNSLNLNLSGFLVNTWIINRGLNLTSSAGSTYESADFNNILATASQLIGTQTNLSQAGVSTASQYIEQVRNTGYFAQEEANIRDQFIVTGGVRMDNSTNNGDIYKFYFYPKASLAWNLTKMKFWKADKIENLKLRVAYGQAGNLAPYGSKFTTLAPANTGGLSGSLISPLLGNDNITPERQTELEGGLDLSLLKGRISLGATYYYKKDYDLLLQQNLPLSSGFTQEWINGGEMENKGVELELGVVPVQSRSFKWEAHISFWKNKAEVTQLLVPAFEPPSFGNDFGSFYIEQGKSPTQIVGFPLDAEGHPSVLGDAAPDFQMGFENEFVFYKNFSLNVFVHWKHGGDNINLTQVQSDFGGTTADYDSHTYDPNIVNGVYRPEQIGKSAAIFVQDASYVRVREIGLYYTVPFKRVYKYIKALKIGASANNYFTFTKYQGYDPEVSNFGINPTSSNVDYDPYPSEKRIFFHVSADF